MKTTGTIFLPGTIFILALLVWFADSASAQGSIFGSVTNNDGSIPPDSDITFIGYLDDTDEEIRINIDSSIGIGYDDGNWYDDFQNYLTEAPGNPYDFHFHNLTNGEGYILSKTIPSNSYQREDITLGPVARPDPPTGFGFEILSSTEVRLHWQAVDNLTWHIYRREASSDGSFFRIDDPTGSLANPGVLDTFFVDTTVGVDSAYEFLIIPEDAAGTLGPPSTILTVDMAGEQFLPGDANGDEIVDIGDPIFIIAYIFRGGLVPDPYEAADANCDGIVDIGDPIYLIAYIFRGGPPPESCP